MLRRRDSSSVIMQKAVAGYSRPCIYSQRGQCKVIFVEKLDRHEVAKCVKELDTKQTEDAKVTHVIFVSSNIPARLHQDLDQISLRHLSRWRFEIFESSFFHFDVLDTALMKRCRPEPLTLAESQRFLTESGFQPHELLQYVSRDFVVRYFGLVPGQIVRIHCEGGVLKYRIFLLSSSSAQTIVQPHTDGATSSTSSSHRNR